MKEHTHEDGTKHAHPNDEPNHHHTTIEAWGRKKSDRVIHETGPVRK